MCGQTQLQTAPASTKTAYRKDGARKDSACWAKAWDDKMHRHDTIEFLSV